MKGAQKHTVVRIEEQRLSSADAAAEFLTLAVEHCLQTGLEKNGRATLVVSGGRTPQPFFVRLSQVNLPWQYVTVTLADERWVTPDHADSNEGMVRRYLLQNRAKDAQFLSLCGEFCSADLASSEGSVALPTLQAIAACDASLGQLESPLDAVVLGMGDDGHTASLFPNQPQLDSSLAPDGAANCVAVRPDTAPHGRVSLSMSKLLDTQRLFLHFSGVSKWTVYESAKREGSRVELPVRAVLHQTRAPVVVVWAP